MRFAVQHRTVYSYSRPVFLEPFTVRLRPRSDASQRLEAFLLAATPEPSLRSDHVDEWGNDVTTLWFDGLTDRLEISASSSVSTARTNPFGFLVDGPDELPAPPIDSPILAVYHGEGVDPAATTFAAEVAADASDVIGFLTRLPAALRERCTPIVREHGAPWPAGRTLAEGRGSCRDLAVVVMQAARSVGLAARFVSGYHAGDDEDPSGELHAWAEVFVPGGGWRGVDATHGLLAADRHVMVAAAAEPGGAAPTTGSFRGTGAQAKMDSAVQVIVSGDGPA